MAVEVPLGPAAVNISGVRGGDANVMAVTILTDGQPFNLTGYTVAASARRSASSEEAIAAVVTLIEPTAGTIEIRWPGSAVAALMNGSGEWFGVWDLQLRPASGDPLTIAAGNFSAAQDVTRT